MQRSKKEVGVVLALMAMAGVIGWPIWRYLMLRAVDDALFARTKALAESKPELRPAWTIALQDDVLTLPEAQVIVEGGGEKLEAAK